MSLVIEWVHPRLGSVRRFLTPVLLALMGGLMFVALADAVPERDGLTSVDGPVSTWFAATRSTEVGHLGLLVARATSPAVVLVAVIAVALLLWRRRMRLESTLLAAATLTAFAGGAIVKYVEGRARPMAPINLAPQAEPSFPSGHVLVMSTVLLVGLVLAWAYLSSRGRLVATAAAMSGVLIVTLDRLVVGAHWATDVLASLSLTAIIVAATLIAVRLLRSPA